MKMLKVVIALLVLGALVMNSRVNATTPMQKQYAANYPDAKAKCTVCHVDKKTLNEYGEALKKQLNGAKEITPAMFKACESKRPKE